MHRLKIQIYHLTLGFAICWIFISTAHAYTEIGNVKIRGNQRIESATILSYFGIKQGSRITRYDLNTGIKKLYDTGFFGNVEIASEGNDLIVTVLENPSINLVAFEGNDALDDDELKREVTLKPRSIYTRTAIQNDVKRLLTVYKRNGYYSAKINPQIIQLEQNRVNLVYEVEEGAESTIRHIAFIGNKAFTSDTLRSIINSESSAWYQFLSSNDKYDPDRLLYDQELLRRHYRSHGYADFKILSAIAELTPDRKEFYLTFTLDEGEPYRFGDIGIHSTLRSVQKPDLEEQLLTKPSDLYNASLIEESIDKMVETLGNYGFAFVDIDPEIAKRTGEDKIIDLTYKIKEGPRVYVERIHIHGNARTLDEVIRREFRLAEGDAYSTSKLRRSEQRLRNLGFFEKLDVRTVSGSAPDKTIIEVEVEEKSTGEITLGAGFSSTDGALADVGITERNLLGRGQSLKLRTMLAAERQQFDLSFTEPYMFNRELAGGIDLYKITQDLQEESSFDRDAVGGKLRTGYKLSERLRHTLFYSFEENKISDVDSTASRFIRDQEGTNVTSMVGHSLIYDDRDNRFAPTSGWFWRFNQDVAGLGGDDHFLRHEVMGEYYYSIAPKWTLAFTGSTGHIASLDDDVRINHRFFVGGRDLRGFDDAGIGPRDTTTGDSLGGNLFWTGSAELRFPLGLPEELGFMGAAFIDAGSLWEVDDSGSEVADDDSVRMSAGLGLAWSSPFGPIRIDFATPIIEEDYDVEENFRFSFGTRF